MMLAKPSSRVARHESSKLRCRPLISLSIAFKHSTTCLRSAVCSSLPVKAIAPFSQLQATITSASSCVRLLLHWTVQNKAIDRNLEWAGVRYVRELF